LIFSKTPDPRKATIFIKIKTDLVAYIAWEGIWPKDLAGNIRVPEGVGGCRIEVTSGKFIP